MRLLYLFCFTLTTSGTLLVFQKLLDLHFNLNEGNPYSYRRKYVELLSDACTEIVKPSIQIKDMAQR